MKSRTDRYGEHESAEKLGIEVHTMGDGFPGTRKTRIRIALPRLKLGALRREVAQRETTTCWFLMSWFTC